MSDVDKTIEAVWKIESTRLIAAIARVTHDIGIAEELAQDALVTALEVWPEEGIPDNPGAWLMKAAKRRAIDSLRRGRMLVQKHEEIARELEWQQQRLGDALEHSLDQVIDDDVLRLIFTAHRAHVAPDRRPHHGGDRACVSCAGKDAGPADLSRQEDPLGGTRSL
jgi:predicted RNA polymerase sigma factor